MPPAKVSTERLVELHGQGLTCPQIGREVGVKDDSVARRLRRLGITPNPGRRGRPPDFVSDRGKNARHRQASRWVEAGLDRPMVSECTRCGHRVEGQARDAIRRMRRHLDSCMS